ncbi:MAG: NAD(P)H-dependent oxidoreductase [Prosthecobacter sp.]|nr:NAD(P)H-dependent oxidoreductase [Prosthecobacter sp.]
MRRLSLRELDFNLHHLGQELEPCLRHSQQEILWAEHLVIVYPVWWGAMPALLKGWLDRVLLPGFAFAEREDGGWDGLLDGRSATLIVTMDTPVWVFRWILRSPSLQSLRAATLNFCGISPVSVMLFSPVRHSSSPQRQQWLQQARQLGTQLEKKLHNGWQARCRAWLQAMRPQFYVFPWLALTAGAVNASASNGTAFRWSTYLLCWAAAWLLEFISVLTNEIHDFKTDTANRNSGPFTGGSRVLVQGLLREPELRAGRKAALGGLVIIALLLAVLLIDHKPQILGLLITGLVLGIGYTAPPLKLAYRTLGELDVALTHSVFVVLLGNVSQGGGSGLQPWLISAPMLFSILPAIILAGFPDLEADAAVGKQTLVVRFGRPFAAKAAMGAAFIAAIMHICLTVGSGFWMDTVILLHACALMIALSAYMRQPHTGRINGLLMLALSYMVWFALAHL